MIISTTVGKKKCSSPHSQQKSPKCSTWVQSQKWQNDLSLLPSKPFNITVIQVFAPTTNAEEDEVEQFYEDLQDFLELTHTKKHILFIMGDWNAKVWSHEIPGVTGKFGLGVQNEAGQRLTVLLREHTRHSRHPLPTTQETTLHMDTTRWPIQKPDWLYSLQLKMEKLYTVSKNKAGSWLWLIT